jgi:hypothetical protein
MQTTIQLPDALFEESMAITAARGATIEELIVEAVAHEVALHRTFAADFGHSEVKLPLVPSLHPRTMDLSRFDFDDLLA